MYQLIPDLDTSVNIEVGDFKLSSTRIKPREDTKYVSKNKKLYVSRSKNDERILSLGFFLPRLTFLNYKEKNYIFKKLDNIRNIQLTKKNNVISAPYIILINLAAHGFKFTESLIHFYFPEIYKENSKKFKFNTQIQLIQEKLGYECSNYHDVEFENYYTTVCLLLQSKKKINDDNPELFDISKMSSVLTSFSEITYKLYIMYIVSDSVQWSVSSATAITQLINTVLITIFNLLTKHITEKKQFVCRLAHNNPLPIHTLVCYYDELSEIISNLMTLNNRYKVNKKIQENLLSFCTVFGEVENTKSN